MTSAPSDRTSHLALALVLALGFSMPLWIGLRYGGLDHSLVLLGMQCALRDGDGLSLDASLGGGGPLLAEPQSGVFYPVTWLLWPISDPELAASLWSVLHLALAGWSAARLGAAVGLPRASSTALGALHALSGTVLNLVLHGAYLAGAAWMPLAWAGAIHLSSSHGRRGAALVAGALGLLLLAGELQGFAITAVMCGAEVLRTRTWRTAGGPLTLAVGAGLLLGMAQWFPTFGIRDAIARSGGLALEQQQLWSLGLPEAFAMVWPGIVTERFSSGATLFHLWFGSADVRVPWNPTPYVGLTALLLGLAAVRDQRFRWWGIVSAGLLLVALGENTPVYAWLETLVPPIGLFRYPAKYIAPASIALLTGTVLTLQSYSRFSGRVLLVGIVGSALVLLGVALNGDSLQASADSFSFGVHTLPGVRPEPASLLLSRGMMATAFAALLLAVWRTRPLWAPWVLVAEFAVATSSHIGVIEPILDFDIPRVALGDASHIVLCTDPRLASGRLDEPERDWGLYGVTLVQRLQHKANLQQCGGPAVPQHYLSSAQAPTVGLWHTHLSNPETQRTAAIALGCTHLATTEPIAGQRIDDGTPPGIAPSVVVLDDSALSVQGVPSPRVFPSANEAVAAALAAPSSSHLRAALDDPSAVAPSTLPASAGTATVRQDSLTDLEVDVSAAGVYVVRRPWWPGWRAEMDGQPLPVVRSAGVQLAVVAPGPGRLRLRYEPPGVAAGLLLALLGGIGTVLLGVRSRRLGDS